MSAAQQIVTLGCGDDLFAVPVDRVQEILDLCPVSRLPHAPPHLLGVIDVRGDDVALADLRTILGLPSNPDTEATRIVVLLLNREGRRAVVALKADRVIEVTRLDEGTLSEVPEAALFSWDERLVSGIGRCNERFVTMLDLEGMFQTVAAASAQVPGIKTLMTPASEGEEAA